MNILFFLTPKSELSYITTEASLQSTLETMEKYRYTVIPVIDKQGKYIGTITEGDLLYNIKNRYLNRMEKAHKISITDLDLRRAYDAVKIDATVEDVFKKSMIQNFVPVVDDDNIFIGIVKRGDIIQYFYNKYIH